MKILAIETSCDETAAAIVENGSKILSNVVASSVALHQKTGGIIPEVAAREQIKCIIPVINEAIEQCNHKTIDAIAVTVGPGLIGSLLVGVETARTLAYVWQKPIVPINHLQAHLYANWLNNKKPQFPSIGLVVSGGHTDLVFMKNHGELKWLGGTRDDAAGECFDKCARILGLGYPGGPAIETAASKDKRQGAKGKIKLPRPMIKQKNYDFSFSGLKTAVLYKSQKTKDKRQKFISLMAREVQAAIVDCLVTKTTRAVKEYKAKSILLSGGVAANTLLRKTLEAKSKKLKVKFFVPPKNLCLDNAAMVASCAYFNLKPIPWEKIQANPSLTITSEA